jgi:hypothetical protein
VGGGENAISGKGQEECRLRRVNSFQFFGHTGSSFVGTSLSGSIREISTLVPILRLLVQAKGSEKQSVAGPSSSDRTAYPEIMPRATIGGSAAFAEVLASLGTPGQIQLLQRPIVTRSKERTICPICRQIVRTTCGLSGNAQPSFRLIERCGELPAFLNDLDDEV